MAPRFRSIVWKFPLLMFALVMATATLFVLAAYSRFSQTLYETAGQRLGTAGSLVAGLVADGGPRRRAQMLAMAQNPAVVRFLETGKDSAGAYSGLAGKPSPTDSSRSRLQLLDKTGKPLIDLKLRPGPYGQSWAEKKVRSSGPDTAIVTISPILNVRGKPEFETVTPVFASTAAHDPVGFVVDTRLISGRGGDAVRGLIGDSTTMIIGKPGEGAWTDLSGLSAAPPEGFTVGRPMAFNRSVRGPGIGIATPIAGTPWVVWLEYPANFVSAPLRKFIWGILPSAAVIGLFGALLVWMLSRRVTRRIVNLSEQIDSLHPDETSELPAAHNATDEIDWLEHSLVRMAQRLEHQRKLENDLRQSQKLEAVGRLAGGIAHDFNNILTVIRNYSEMVREELPKDGALIRDIDEVIRASVRAADLTSQLLAFSRHKVVEPQVLDINQVIGAATKMLRRVVASNIELTTELSDDSGRILADSGQIEQILMNLTMNAADAMPEGGRITIKNGRAKLDGAFQSGNDDSTVREYVCLMVTDTGHGMDQETVRKIFEPFFTTKEQMKGTGLGLATVHGIVTAAGGKVWVYSEPGAGTTFKLYFPLVEADLHPDDNRFRVDSAVELRGTQRILLVEDDQATREVVRRMLEKRGYRVDEAASGAEGIQLMQAHDEIELVITDLMLPGIDGATLAARLREINPTIPILMMSGYSEHEIATRNLHQGNERFIEKPFTTAAMVRAVHESIAAAGDRWGSALRNPQPPGVA